MKKLNNKWYGWKPDLPDHRDLLYGATATIPKKLPSKVDLRPLCSPVENQGSLSSCVANALAGNLEFLEKKDKIIFFDMSRLFIYYNARAIDGTVNQDGGSYIRSGIKGLVSKGCCPESEWAYTPSQVSTKPPVSCYKHAQDHQVTSYKRITSLKEMKNCLAEGYPFVFGFSVYDYFESDEMAKSGILKMPDPSESLVGGHAVCSIGYDDSTKMFIIRNSWGADWGQGGYFMMPYDYISNPNLADDFWSIRAGENI